MIPDRLRPHLLMLAVLVTAVTVVYGRTLGHDFLVNWDDNVYVTANVSIQGFSVGNLRTVFTNYYAGNYAPVQMLSYMLDYALWGLWAGGFLLTNMVLHTLNGLMLYAILLKSHADKLLAAVGAAIFLLHPVQVESVAWISQRKNLLAMFFMLLAWVVFIRYRKSEESGGRLAYVFSLAAFTCSLLSKSASVFFPLSLLLYDYCFSAEERKVRLLDKIPFFILAGAAALITMQSQSPDVTGLSGIDFGGRRSWNGGSHWVTLLTMLPVFCSYLRMIVWPFGLSALYIPLIRTIPDLTVLAALLIIIATGYLLWRLWCAERRLSYWPIFSILAILPVSQIIPLITLMNDRYLYFPMIGVAALVGAGAVLLRKSLNEKVLTGIIILLLLMLAVISFKRVTVWGSSRTLWGDVVSKYPDNFDAWEGLGEAYHLSAPVALPEAEYAYNRAFAIYSSGPNNLFNLARVNILQGDNRKGIALLQRLLKISPQYVMGWTELGDIYFKKNLYRDAEHAYKMAENLQPEALEVQLRLYRLYLITDDAAAAQFYYEKFLSFGGDISVLKP